MLTYKQLLQKCDREALKVILLSKTIDDMSNKWTSNDKNDRDLLDRAQETVDKGYCHVIDTMIAKTGVTPKYAIIVNLAPEEKFHFAGQEEIVPAYIDVSYYNSSALPYPEGKLSDAQHNDTKYHRYLGFGLCAWDEFVNSDVVVTPEAVLHLGSINFLERVAAEILWEQTFHGYTEEDQDGFKKMIMQRSKDVKSGKIKTKKLKKKKGDKYTIHIPEDMLAPAKKKRSNKKKK